MLLFFQVEYILVKFDDKNKVARVSLRAQELLAILNQREADDPTGKIVHSIHINAFNASNIFFSKRKLTFQHFKKN